MATETYSTQAIAALLAVTDRAIQIRAKRESWQSLPRAGRGGGKLWIVSSMPAETVQGIRAALATQAALACAEAPPAANPAARPAGFAAVPDKKLDMARARHRIVLEWRAHMERAKAEGRFGPRSLKGRCGCLQRGPAAARMGTRSRARCVRKDPLPLGKIRARRGRFCRAGRQARRMDAGRGQGRGPTGRSGGNAVSQGLSARPQAQRASGLDGHGRGP